MTAKIKLQLECTEEEAKALAFTVAQFSRRDAMKLSGGVQKAAELRDGIWKVGVQISHQIYRSKEQTA